jgi:NADPH-dependent 2,4-dienoyl-CoA reductase/sulfur reductase-like enzyme
MQTLRTATIPQTGERSMPQSGRPRDLTMEAGTSVSEKLQSLCCIAGGGPAGMMLGYLLARAGIEVLILENTRTSWRLPWRHGPSLDS